jgi:site-specific DNA-methyltransferase (cytosine-N4-specific)
MPKRFIEMLTKPGDIVVDPFGGSGIIPITAVELGRVGVCFDISPDQVKAAKARASLVFGKDKYKKLVGEND